MLQNFVPIPIFRVDYYYNIPLAFTLAIKFHSIRFPRKFILLECGGVIKTKISIEQICE